MELDLGLSHQAYVTFVYALPLAAAAILEAGTALLSDVWSRARLVILGQSALAAALFFTAWTSSPWGLASGLALAGAASGVACGAAQALLVVARPEDTDRAMVRWSLYCAIGDVLAPLMTAVAIAFGHSYRAAMGAIAIVVSTQCAISATLVRDKRLEGRYEGSAEPLEGKEPLRAALPRALHLPRLWAGLFAAAWCTLLDELVIALAVLRLAHERAASVPVATAVALTFSVGSVMGAAMTEHAVARASPRRVLVASAALTAIALLGLLSSRSALEVGGCAAGCRLSVLSAPRARICASIRRDPGTPGRRAGHGTDLRRRRRCRSARPRGNRRPIRTGLSARMPSRSTGDRLDLRLGPYLCAPSLIQVSMRSTCAWSSTVWSSGIVSPHGASICISLALTLLNIRLVVALP